MYKYGMKYRGAAPGCQPKRGLLEILEDPTGKYWNILLYDRPLKEKEEREYEMDFLSIIL